jgi:phosphoribosylformylglycinamidine synthase
VRYLAEQADVEARFVKAVLAELEAAVLGSVHKRGLGVFTWPGVVKITTVKVPARPARKGKDLRPAVLVFPGINRERDMARALKLVGARAPAMVWHAQTELPAGTDLVVIPGGFSYGDYLRCGAIAARAPIMDAVRTFAQKGGLVLAVCNGFQIACEAGLLPGVLMRNAQLRFVCRDVFLRVERSDTPFTRGYNAGQVIRVPVAHGEGNYIADGETIARLEGEGRVVFRYAAPDGLVDPNWNHNGAMNAIAGIINARGNVLGMMPHPENHVEAAMGCTDGRALFAGLAEHLRLAA